jgi:hypothetical protein
MRAGNQGPEMWEKCLSFGVAAITYQPLAELDLSKYPRFEPRKEWKMLASSQRASLARFVYGIRKGDTIYVKQGPKIICKGIVRDGYRFDYKHRIIDPFGTPWNHQIPVKWESNFPSINVCLGAEQITVLPISKERLKRLESATRETHKIVTLSEAQEGELSRREASFRKRNRALIESKKALSDGRCEVCSFDFKEKYLSLNKDCLIAHHLSPLSLAKRIRITSIKDIVLICPNCHSVIHTQNPPMPLSVLKKRIR